MTATCTVPMPTEIAEQLSAKVRRAFVLTEIVVVVFIVAMFTALAVLSLANVAYNNSFKNQAHELVGIFKMAVLGAAQSDRRYEVILNFAEQNYKLREITTGLVLVEDILEEEIILAGEFNDEFQLSYVMFDDGETTNDEPALFRAGRVGWQYGGKVVLLDSEGNEFSIVINRLSRLIRLVRGDAELLLPRSPDEMQF